MGEYAVRKSDGAEIKIGTCESMYYLRWDQAHDVTAKSGNVDPIADREEIRFRFPVPTEDNVKPGEFDYPVRGVTVHGARVPEGVEHYSVQFRADGPGYNLCLPCPESMAGDELTIFVKGPDGKATMSADAKIHRNGFNGGVKVAYQKWFNGMLITVCECGACGALYRLETVEMAQEVADLLNAEADRREHAARVGPHYGPDEDVSHEGAFWRTVASRMMAGYSVMANAS